MAKLFFNGKFLLNVAKGLFKLHKVLTVWSRNMIKRNFLLEINGFVFIYCLVSTFADFSILCIEVVLIV